MNLTNIQFELDYIYPLNASKMSSCSLAEIFLFQWNWAKEDLKWVILQRKKNTFFSNQVQTTGAANSKQESQHFIVILTFLLMQLVVIIVLLNIFCTSFLYDLEKIFSNKYYYLLYK